MPRRVANPRKREMLLRLTEEEADTLSAAAHLDDVTPNAYAYAILRAHVASLASNDFVQDNLENKRSYREQRATVEQLRPERDAGAEDKSANS